MLLCCLDEGYLLPVIPSLCCNPHLPQCVYFGYRLESCDGIWFSTAFPQPYLAGNLALVYFVNLIQHLFLRQVDVFSFGGQRGKG